MQRYAGIAGNFANHSLCAYGASTLFQAACSEKLIQQRTGHRSLEALRQYEHTSQSQLLDISNDMAGAKPREIVSSTVTEKSSSVVNTSPTIVLSGCTFTGCSFNFTGGTVSQAKKDVVEEKCLEGLDVDNIFGD